jgi:hypothetical protein
VSHNSAGEVLIEWFTFLSTGAPVWYYAVLDAQGASYDFTGAMYSTRWVNGKVQQQVVGSLELDTFSVGNGRLIWKFTAGNTSGMALISYDILGNGTGSAPNPTGAWYTPAQSGWGAMLDAQGNSLLGELGIYDPSGNPIWLAGATTWNASSQSYTVSLTEYNGRGLCPTCSGTQSLTGQAMGSMQISSISPCHGLLSINLSSPLAQWNKTNLPITCLTD